MVCLSLQSGSCTLVASIGKLGREGGGEKSGVKSVTFYRGGVRIISCESPGHSFISFASCSGSYMLGDFLSFFFPLEILRASFPCPRLLRDKSFMSLAHLLSSEPGDRDESTEKSSLSHS